MTFYIVEWFSGFRNHLNTVFTETKGSATCVLMKTVVVLTNAVWFYFVTLHWTETASKIKRVGKLNASKEYVSSIFTHFETS